MKSRTQRLPTGGRGREALRERGQFWTPDWVARAMVAYAAQDGADHLFDPAVGAGAFFNAAKSLSRDLGRRLRLLGAEIDRDVLREAAQNGLSESDLAGVELTDFVLNPPKGPFKAIVANPPYIRHHRLNPAVKSELKTLGRRLIGRPLDGRAGLHIYFLLRALQLLDSGGRLAFIMPADTCEGVFSSTLWGWITARYRLEAVTTFAPGASPFPTVDTNPIIFMIRNAAPGERFVWAECSKADSDHLTAWVLSKSMESSREGLRVERRQLREGLATGFSRPPSEGRESGLTLGDFARVVRGIATGANQFFFLTVQQAAELQIPERFLIRAIGRTRDASEDVITAETLAALDAAGRPTLLFSPNGEPIETFPQSVMEYLKQGEQLGINRRPLIARRRPWYRMERRPAPPFLFAYLGRRNARFIRNVAGVVPLTGFLCVYPKLQDPGLVNRLWEILRKTETVANLKLVGKSYGGGAIKVEPRALEKLPLPV